MSEAPSLKASFDRERLEALWRDDRHWRLGGIYHCAADPRIVVRQRHRWGWTWNFARPWTIPCIVVLALLVIAPAAMLRARRTAMAAYIGGLVLVVIPIAVYLARPPTHGKARNR